MSAGDGGLTSQQSRASTDAGAIADVALAAGVPHELPSDQRAAIIVPAGGSLAVVEPTHDRDLPTPRRPRGTATVYEVDGLAVLWAKHSHLGVSEVYADPERFTVTAVLNADVGAGLLAGHRDHRIHLVCRKSPAWIAWTASDGKLVDQTTFAEFLEDRLPEIVEPTGATMLELAQSFQATTKVEFKGAVALTSSTRKLQFEETATAKAGQRGDIEIPATFQLALQPFLGSAAYRVTARFRYRIRDGHLTIGYRLDRPDEVLREAFSDVQRSVSEATESPVVIGSPPPAVE